MRMIMEVSIPNEPFNTIVRDGSAGKTIQKALEATKPQSVYFTEINGQRGGILIVDVKDPSAIPSDAQPYLKLAPSTQSVSVELTYRDGSVSEIKSFRR